MGSQGGLPPLPSNVLACLHVNCMYANINWRRLDRSTALYIYRDKNGKLLAVLTHVPKKLVLNNNKKWYILKYWRV
jgi:hypothetical protein